ncbi:MAG: hypothetical protein JXR77_13300 [Lentisphaeria bacterium]|nr:hypothetical protein [Lentisphaeria bacterium]
MRPRGRWLLPGHCLLAVLLPLAGGGVARGAGEEHSEATLSRLALAAWEDLRDTSLLHGFVEGRMGYRLGADRREESRSLAETRLQLEYEAEIGPALLEVTGDFLFDDIAADHGIRLEKGEGWLDLREAVVSFTPAHVADVKVGRQILTWGTGDLLFVNDLFPKDWNAFFIGRDQEYLKAPSDAVKISLFSDLANLDVVYTPRFDANRFPDNRRISQWNPFANRPVGRETHMRLDRPDEWFRDDELALRLYRVLRGYELALYGYHGFWKDPVGFRPANRRAAFPDLSVVGASVRGTVGRGIGHIEMGYYDSRDDRDGDDWLAPNSQWRFLAGYEQEIARDLTAGAQYYLELMEDYGAYDRSQPAGFPAADRDRHVLTLRLTKLLLSQNLTLSLFAYWSPSDADAYLRPRVHYKVNDRLGVEAGGNLFLGSDRHTFFGQFQDNTNAYAGVRYSF